MMLWILTSCIVVLTVIGLRFLLRKKLDLRVRYALWLIVLVRLLIPIHIGGSPLSAANLLTPAAPAAAVQSLPDDDAAVPLLPGLPVQTVHPAAETPPVAASQEESPLQQAQQQQIPRQQAQQQAVPLSPTPTALKLTPWQIHLLVWAFGSFCVLLAFVVFNLRLNRRLHRTRELLDNSQKLPIYSTDAITSPCLYGFFHPAVYLTSEAAADETVRLCCISHELTHYRHRDNLWAMLRIACLVVHWYNPFVWWAAVLSCRDAELACDETTMKHLGSNLSAAYGYSLMEIACGRQSVRKALLVPTLHFSGNIKERIQLLCKKPKNGVVAVISMVLVLSLLCACAFTGQAGSQNPDSTTPPTTENSDITEITEPSTAIPETTEPSTSAVEPTSQTVLPTEYIPVTTVQVLADTSASEFAINPFTGYTAFDSVAEASGKVFYYDGNSIRCYPAGSTVQQGSVLYEGSFITYFKFLCTDGKTLFLIDKGKDIIRVNVETKAAEKLFSVDAYSVELIGATDTTVYLGIQQSEKDWWGRSIRAYDLHGKEVHSYGDGLEGWMKDGVLVLMEARSDTRPVGLLAIDTASGNPVAELKSPETAWDAVVLNGALYYSYVGSEGEMSRGACTVKRVDKNGVIALLEVIPATDSWPCGFFDEPGGPLRLFDGSTYSIKDGSPINIPEGIGTNFLAGTDNHGTVFFAADGILYRPDGRGGYFEACRLDDPYATVVSIIDDVVFYLGSSDRLLRTTKAQ